MNPYLKVWLRFNDPDNVAKDECGNQWSIEQKDTTDTAPTIINADTPSGKACDFGGTQAFLSTTPPTLGTSDFTVDWWEFIPAGIDSFYGEIMVIEDRTQNTPSYTFNITYQQTPYLRLFVGNGSDWLANRVTAGGTIRDEWVHRAVVRSGDYFLAFENGSIGSRTYFGDTAIDTNNLTLFVGNLYRANRPFPGALADIRIHVGIALWTENFTPPTEDDYDIQTFPFAENILTARSVVKSSDNFANAQRTIETTNDNLADTKRSIIRTADNFGTVDRLVAKSTEVSTNANRTVEVSAVNDIAPVKRTTNDSASLADISRRIIRSENVVGNTLRTVLFGSDNYLLTHRRLSNLGEEFGYLLRLVHEPQVIDVYTRRQLVNDAAVDTDLKRQILYTTDNLADLSRSVICSADDFSALQRTVDKTSTESANSHRRVIYFAENDLLSTCRVLNDDTNTADTVRYITVSDNCFVSVCRAIIQPSDNFADTLRQTFLNSVIITLVTLQGVAVGSVRFYRDKQSSIGNLCTRYKGITFYAGLVHLNAPLASDIVVYKGGLTYAVIQEE